MIETLTDREKEIYKQIKEKFKTNNRFMIDYQEYAFMQNTLEKLKSSDCILLSKADQVCFVTKQPKFDFFQEESKEQEKIEKKLSRREWKIAIVSAIVGSLIGLIPYIVSLLT